MKPIKTKRELRDELNRQMQQYLQCGGQVKEVARGISGRDVNAPLTNVFPHQGGSEPRTPVAEVVAAIESRRKPVASPNRRRHKPRPRKKVILDDFGQPLRWEWVEE